MRTCSSIQSGTHTKSNRILIFEVGSLNVAYKSIRRRDSLWSHEQLSCWSCRKTRFINPRQHRSSSGFDANLPDDSPFPCFVPPGWLTALIYSLLMTSKVNTLNWEELMRSNTFASIYSANDINKIRKTGFRPAKALIEDLLSREIPLKVLLYIVQCISKNVFF